MIDQGTGTFTITSGHSDRTICTAEVMRQYEAEWRALAFANHSCVGKYGDDGEMQCNHCLIDFKRDSPSQISEKLYVRGIQQWNGYRDELAAARRALLDLYDNIGGHGHWDAQGNYGATCPVCMRQGEARERCREAVAQARAAL